MQKDPNDFLIEWTCDFLRNKDAISKKIEKIERKKGQFDLYVKYKDKEQYFILMPAINDVDEIIRKIGDSQASGPAYFSVLTLNSAKNFDMLVHNWDKLSKFRFLSLIFVNPFSQNEKKWIIFPYTHNNICDRSSLKNGLRSISEAVDTIDEPQLYANITS